MIQTSQYNSCCGVMILAAGLGKRMRSSLPKVLHEINGKPLLFHILQQVKAILPNASVGLVLGYGREQIEAYLKRESEISSLDINFIIQPEQRGTGHAARCAIESEWGKKLIQLRMPILVLPGDSPLITAELIKEMISPLKKNEAMRLLTCEQDNPFGYGRVIRKNKTVLRIVEEKDAKPKEKKIKEVAVSIYLFKSELLEKALQTMNSKNAQGEYYLTDSISFFVKNRKQVSDLLWKNSDDLKGINDPWELSEANVILNHRTLKKWAIQGVKFIDPHTTQVDCTVKLSENVVVHPGVILLGLTQIGSGTIVGPRVILKDVIVGENVNLKAGTVIEQSEIGSNAQIGPYAHLRPQSFVGAGSKIGNFVELKKTKIGDNSSVAHLSYLGDAEVGKNVNIGCGFITCNFDGRIIEGQRKHQTIIEDDVFLGSDCQTVAPVRVGKSAYVASGSTVTEDVPPEALAIARCRQMNKLGYAKKLRGKNS